MSVTSIWAAQRAMQVYTAAVNADAQTGPAVERLTGWKARFSRRKANGQPGTRYLYDPTPCVRMNLGTRSIVRFFSSAGDVHGKTVISALGASEATSTEIRYG